MAAGKPPPTKRTSRRELVAFGGRYRIVTLIGSGGMGRIFLADDLKLGRQVAIKLIRQEYADDPLFLERFRREALAAAAVHHPNIVQVYEVAQTEQGLPYIVMEALNGHDLWTELKTLGRLPLYRAIDIAGQVLFALGAAHRSGIVHRDLKPGNIFLTRRAIASLSEIDCGGGQSITVKLLDFGVSRFLTPETTQTYQLTAKGDVLGTIKYMAPEQLDSSHDIDGRADLYSVGVILYECVTGQSPFGTEEGVTPFMHRSFRRPIMSAHSLVNDVPEDFDEVLTRALAQDPDDRFPNATAFVRALRPFYGLTPSGTTTAPESATIRMTPDEMIAERIRQQIAEATTVIINPPEDGADTEIDVIGNYVARDEQLIGEDTTLDAGHGFLSELDENMVTEITLLADDGKVKGSITSDNTASSRTKKTKGSRKIN